MRRLLAQVGAFIRGPAFVRRWYIHWWTSKARREGREVHV